VFGILAEDRCVLIGESWNLKARLLELINTLHSPETLTIIYELCSEDQRLRRREVLHGELVSGTQPSNLQASRNGISFWQSVPDGGDSTGDGPEAV